MDVNCPTCDQPLFTLPKDSVLAGGTATCANCGTYVSWSMTPSGPKVKSNSY